MAAAMEVFTASDCFRYKIQHVLETVGQRVLLYTLQRGTPHRSGLVHLIYYLKSLPQESTARYKKMNHRERRDCFNNTEVEIIDADSSWGTFDVSLLCKAIPFTCEGWQDKDGRTLRLAQNVNKIRDTRNAVAHETFTTVSEQDFLTKLSHLRTLLHSILEDTKDKYKTDDSDDDSECNAIKTEVDEIINDIQQERLSIREIQQSATADLLPSFKSEADEELRRALDRDKFIDPLHFLSQHESDRVEALNIFTPVIITENIGRDKRNVDPFKMLSHTQSGSPRLILVEGDAGSGKTTLLTYTVCEYLKEESDRRMEGLYQFDLLLRVVCREETSRTLETLLERLLPDAFYKYGRLVMTLIKHSRVLVLFDGLDEQRDVHRHLVRDILNQAWPSLTLLATSRPEAVRTMRADTPREFNVSHLLLEGVSPDRRTQLALQYHEWLCADVPQSDARLRQVMEQIGWKELFRLPLNIVFLTKIVAEGSDGMIVCESELYQKILDWCVEKLKDRLLRKMCGAQDEILLDVNIKNIVKQCCRVSYEGLLRGEIYLSDEDVQSIAKRCDELGLPLSEILPAFYSLRRHVTQGGVTCQKYHSPHKGLQDFTAARHMMDSLSDYRDGAIRDKLVSDIQRQLLVSDTPGQHCDLRALRQMLRHLLGLLSQKGEAKAREMQEMLCLIKDSGVRDTDDWLHLLADTKVQGKALQTVAEYINGSSDTGFIIHDGTVSIATALLPLIRPRYTKLFLHREPREVDQLGVALHHHNLTEMSLQHHYRQPSPGAYSNHLLHQIDRSYLREFKGHLDAEHLNLLPQGLERLELSVSSLDHAERLIPLLANVRGKCPKREQLSVHVSVSTLGSPPSTSLPGGVAGNVTLAVSDVSDRNVDLACDIIAAMSPSDGTGYNELNFPLATLTFGGWRRLIEGLASRRVIVRGCVVAPDTTVTKEDEGQLNSLTEAMLGCGFERYPGNLI